VQAVGEVSVDEVGEDRERDVEVDGERDLGAERVEVEGADLFGELVLDPPAFGVALDQLLAGAAYGGVIEYLWVSGAVVDSANTCCSSRRWPPNRSGRHPVAGARPVLVGRLRRAR
jgi:hypothetical protein